MISTITAALPLIFLYVVFFISQSEYYTSAFGGVLPQGYNYSEYARSGFFELCRVAGLNAVFIFAAHVFTKNASKTAILVKKSVIILLSICSLCLIATAMAKMFLYINAYGMTQKRVYVSLFMILMALGFVFTVFAQFFSKIKMTWVCLVLSLLMIIVPAFSNFDSVIASYNISRYMDNTLYSVDYDYLDSIAAMPSYEKLYESDAATEADRAIIRSKALDVNSYYRYKNRSGMCFNIPVYSACNSAQRIIGE